MVNNKKKNRISLYKKVKEDVQELERYLKEYVDDIWATPEVIDKYKEILKLTASTFNNQFTKHLKQNIIYSVCS